MGGYTVLVAVRSLAMVTYINPQHTDYIGTSNTKAVYSNTLFFSGTKMWIFGTIKVPGTTPVMKHQEQSTVLKQTSNLLNILISGT